MSTTLAATVVEVKGGHTVDASQAATVATLMHGPEGRTGRQSEV
jgi:hypothetical protein